MCLIMVGLAACSSARSDGNGDADETSLVGRCSGEYVCDIDGEEVTSVLSRQASACFLGQIELLSDGTGVGPDSEPYTWEGDAEAFDLCTDGYCFDCFSEESIKNGECVGSATSCQSIPKASCYAQSGCQYNVGSTLAESDDKCSGSAASCSYFTSRSSCIGQSGCSWE